MYIRNGVAYAGEPQLPLKVVGIKPLSDFSLWLRFSNGECKVFDFKPLLDDPCYQTLKDEKIFKEAYIDYGVPVWNNGEIDIAPEYVYENSSNF